MKPRLLFIFMVLCLFIGGTDALAWRGRAAGGGGVGFTWADSFGVGYPHGYIGEIGWGAKFAITKTPSIPLFRVLPATEFGCTAVRLEKIHGNPESDTSTSLAVQDSAVFGTMWMVIGFFNSGYPDTITEDCKSGIGEYVMWSQLTGFLSPPPDRGSSAYSAMTSTDRATGTVNAPGVVRLALDFDSIQVWVKQSASSNDGAQDLYFGVKYGTFPSLTQVPLRRWHITTCDTAFARWDIVPIAHCDSTASASLIYTSVDLGPIYTIASNPPWGNKTSADAAFNNGEMENDLYFYDGHRKIIETTLAATLAATDSAGAGGLGVQMLVNRPSWWPASVTSFSQYQSTNRPVFGEASNAMQILVMTADQGPSRKMFSFIGSTNYVSSLDTASGKWRIRLNESAGGNIPDTTFPIGSRCVLIVGYRARCGGTEDFGFDGYYGTGQRPNPMFSDYGVNVQVTGGLDSTSGTARAHYNNYQVWIPGYGNSPLRFPKGFDLYYQKSYWASLAGTTWRMQSTVVWFSYGNQSTVNYTVSQTLGGAAATGVDDAAMWTTSNDATVATKNYGGRNGGYVGMQSGGLTENRMMFRPDWRSVMPDVNLFTVTVNSARCSLWCPENTGSVDLEVHKLLEDWVEGTQNNVYQYGSSSWNNQGIGTGVTGATISSADSAWSTAGGTYSPTVSASATVSGAANSWKALTFTTMVSQQVATGITNYGFVMIDPTPVNNNYCDFRTTEWATTNQRPYFFINYTFTYQP